MFTNREMVNFQKWDFCEFSLYFYYKLCHYVYWQGQEICLLRRSFAFLKRVMYKNISSRKSVDLFISLVKKIIPDGIAHTFQEVDVLIQLLIFCQRHNIFSWHRVNHQKID